MHISLPEKRYYSIGELAQAFGVKTSLLRFWEKEFDEINPRKNAKGDRKFTPKDVKVIELIFHLLKEKGYTIAGAKAYLKTSKKEAFDKHEIVSRLQKIKAELIGIKEAL